MCFTNLPVEFDENGDPYLAEVADDVDRPDTAEHDHAAEACDCADADAPLEADPEAAYETLVAAVSDATRDHLTDGTEATGDDAADPDAPDAGAAEGD